MRQGFVRRAPGFTLVELMVGLAVGLFVVLAAISVFVSTRTLQTVSSAESRMGENSRLAMELLRKDFRSAGFQGCKAILAAAPLSLLNPSAGLFLDGSGSGSGLAGSHGDGTSSFTPALNATLAGLPQAPLANSDVVSLRVPVEPLSLGLAAAMTASTDAPTVGANTPGNTIATGDIVLVANCKAGAMLQVTEVDPKTTGILSHAVGAGSPGNATGDLLQVFGGDATVYKLQTHYYYVANSVQQPGTSSMWRYTYPNTGSPLPLNPQEVVQGIDRMLVTYGIDDGTGNQTVSRYVSADAVASWDSVITARVQLLSSTVKNGMTLSPQAASFAGGTVIPTDKRLRTQVTEVVTLRNRAP